MKKLTTISLALSLMSTSVLLGLTSQDEVLAKAHEIIETPITVSEEALLDICEEHDLPNLFEAECYLKENELVSFLPHFESSRAFVESIPNLPMSYSTVSFDSAQCCFRLLLFRSLFRSLEIKELEIPTLYGIALYTDEDEDNAEMFVVAESLIKGKTIMEHLDELSEGGTSELSQAQEMLYTFGHALASLHRAHVHTATMHPDENQLIHCDLKFLELQWSQKIFDDLPFTFQDIKQKMISYLDYKSKNPYPQCYCGLFEDLDDVTYNSQKGTFAFYDKEYIVFDIDMQKKPIGNSAQDYISVMESLQAVTKGRLSDEEYHSLVEAFNRGYCENEGVLPSAEDTAFFTLRYLLGYLVLLDKDGKINQDFLAQECGRLTQLLAH